VESGFSRFRTEKERTGRTGQEAHGYSWCIEGGSICWSFPIERGSLTIGGGRQWAEIGDRQGCRYGGHTTQARILKEGHKLHYTSDGGGSHGVFKGHESRGGLVCTLGGEKSQI